VTQIEQSSSEIDPLKAVVEPMQSTQVDCPTWSMNVPFGQSMQSCPGNGPNLPTLQGWHSEDPAEYVSLPRGHAEQMLEASKEKKFFSQFEHIELPCAANFPAEQSKQAELPK
jgi:hypothetical protein